MLEILGQFKIRSWVYIYAGEIPTYFSPKTEYRESTVILMSPIWSLDAFWLCNSCCQRQGNLGIKTPIKPDIGDPVHLNDYITVRYSHLDDTPCLDRLWINHTYMWKVPKCISSPSFYALSHRQLSVFPIYVVGGIVFLATTITNLKHCRARTSACDPLLQHWLAVLHTSPDTPRVDPAQYYRCLVIWRRQKYEPLRLFSAAKDK